MKELVKTEFFQYYTQSEIDIILQALKEIDDKKKTIIVNDK